MCTSPVQPICTFSCTAHFISLHILPLTLFHYLFLISFSSYLYIYIYSLVFLFHSFYCFYVIFILLSCFIFLSCTFHWADLSWLTFHYLLYPVWLCMWQIIKNLEPWTLQAFECPAWCTVLPHRSVIIDLAVTTCETSPEDFFFFCD